MKAFHVVCGLPRSGSTLLCNILAQNPGLNVLHTSPLPVLLQWLADGMTNSPDIKGMVDRDQSAADAWLFDTARGVARNTYPGQAVAIDKNRAWNGKQFLLRQLFPDAKMLACIRDLRAVFGSFERQWRRNPLFLIPPGETTRQRLRHQFAADGMIGAALEGLDDLHIHAHESVRFVKYEALAHAPRLELQQIYQHLGLPEFEHDLDNIKSTAMDLDALYLGKFPHKGEGKLSLVDDWQEFVPKSLADEIMVNNAAYNSTFDYR